MYTSNGLLIIVTRTPNKRDICLSLLKRPSPCPLTKMSQNEGSVLAIFITIKKVIALPSLKMEPQKYVPFIAHIPVRSTIASGHYRNWSLWKNDKSKTKVVTNCDNNTLCVSISVMFRRTFFFQERSWGTFFNVTQNCMLLSQLVTDQLL